MGLGGGGGGGKSNRLYWAIWVGGRVAQSDDLKYKDWLAGRLWAAPFALWPAGQPTVGCRRAKEEEGQSFQRVLGAQFEPAACSPARWRGSARRAREWIILAGGVWAQSLNLEATRARRLGIAEGGGTSLILLGAQNQDATDGLRRVIGSLVSDSRCLSLWLSAWMAASGRYCHQAGPLGWLAGPAAASPGWPVMRLTFDWCRPWFGSGPAQELAPLARSPD